MRKHIAVVLAVTLFVINGGCATEKAGFATGELLAESAGDLNSETIEEKDSGKKDYDSDGLALKESASDTPKANVSKAPASDATKADVSKTDVSEEDAFLEDDSASDLFDEMDTESDDALEPDEFVDGADDERIQEAGKAGIVTDEAERQELLEQIREGSLDVENDTFAFEEMTSFVGKPEKDLISLIDADGHPDGFATKLFGEDVAISCTVDGEKVTGIRLLFAQTDGKLLANAISEELGSDPDEAEGGLVWTYQGKVVRQQDADGGILVTVAQEK